MGHKLASDEVVASCRRLVEWAVENAAAHNVIVDVRNEPTTPLHMGGHKPHVEVRAAWTNTDDPSAVARYIAELPR